MMFLVAVTGDPGVQSDDASCAVSAICAATTRMEAVALMRSFGLSVRSKQLTPIDAAPWVPDDPPRVGVGEVWVRPVYVKGEWRKLKRTTRG